MLLRRIAPLLFAVSFAFALTACDGPPGQPSSIPGSAVFIDPEGYGAIPMVYPIVTSVRVANDTGGDIIVMEHEVPNAKEVALDYTAYMSGGDPVVASAQARRAVTVTMSYESDGRVSIWARNTQQPLQGTPSATLPLARLHVRVPANVDLDLQTRDGRITVSGAVRSVYANATRGIGVRGVQGALNLLTTGGGIVVEGGSGQRIETRAQSGNITIFSTEASVTASISDTGDLEFIGTLAGRDNSFLTSSGAITVALPEDAPYSFLVTTPRGKLATDFRPDKSNPADGPRAVCGLIYNQQSYDYHVRNLEDLYGHLYLDFNNQGTYISGTLSRDLLYFFTDRGEVTFYTPYPHAIHIYAADASNSTEINQAGKLKGAPDCEQPPPDPPVRFTARTQSGLIFIHHILMQRQ